MGILSLAGLRAAIQSVAEIAAPPPADHRPWPPPEEPWVMAQMWSRLLFAHWPLRPAAIRPLVPSALPLDTFDGEAWLAVTPFELNGLRMRSLPPSPESQTFRSSTFGRTCDGMESSITLRGRCASPTPTSVRTR